VKITPLDIKKQEFARKFRGYSPVEVHTYLEMIAGEFEDILKKNLEFEEEILSLENKLSSYTKMESVLQDTLVNTHRSAEEMKSAAERKARAIADEARIAADRIKSEARVELLHIRRQIEELQHQRDSFIISFKSLLDTQHAMLEMIHKKDSGLADFKPARMRSDLTDDDLDRVVDQFEKEISKKANDKADSKSPSEGEKT